MKKNIFIIVSVVAVFVLVSMYSGTPDKVSTEKLVVAASFYSLGHFAEQIGKDTVEVFVITPPGVEAHDFEPSPRDIINITNADVFIYNGGGFDPWAEKISQSMESNGATVINMSDELSSSYPDIDLSNPHFWLDPILAMGEVTIIRNALINANLSQKGFYEFNTDAFNEKLFTLNREYEEGLAMCTLRDVIVSHSAFEYLGKRYTIKVHSIAGISPDEEPSPRELGELATLARERGIKHIFFEMAVSSKLAETVAQEIGAETLVLNPIETLTNDEIKAGEDYVSIMKKNLNNLRRALQCI